MAREALVGLADDADSPARPRTVGALWLGALTERRTGPAYLAERSDGTWEPVTWAAAARRVEELAGGLLALGIAKGDAFGILASTRVEWVLFDYALALVGAVTVPVYATSSARDCAYALDHADAVGVLYEDAEQLAKLGEAGGNLPRLRHRLAFADLDELAASGREYAAARPDALAEAIASVEEDDLYTFIYTSGTTGPPKACMIRHRNAFEMASSIGEIADLVDPTDVVLLWLPLAHNFGRILHLAGARVGFTTAFCADPARLAEALPQVRPTILPSVPRVFEKVYDATCTAFAAQRGPRRALVRWALAVGRQASPLRCENRPLPRALALQHALASRLVYARFRDRLGGRVKVAVSGAAPLSAEISEFFHALDVLILEGYGLTECTAAATVNRPGRFRFGTVGLPLPGFEVKTAIDGELLIRSGTVFAGYYKDEDATRRVLDEDGWLHTGDIAEIDQDGFVHVTDRKKDILVTAGGKNVAPQNLENELRASPLVSQALVVGDRRPYVAALITLDPDELTRWARARGVDEDAEQLTRRPDVLARVQELVDDVNRGRTRFEQIKRFAVLPRDFSAGEDEVTPTMKLRRRVCEQHFAAEIEALYAES